MSRGRLPLIHDVTPRDKRAMQGIANVLRVRLSRLEGIRQYAIGETADLLENVTANLAAAIEGLDDISTPSSHE